MHLKITSFPALFLSQDRSPMPSTSFPSISGNLQLCPGAIQACGDEEFNHCLSPLFIFRTLDGSWQMVRERAHTHPRVSQVSRLPLGVQKCSQERRAGNFSQPRPHRLLSHFHRRLGAGPEKSITQESGSSGPWCCWSPPFREGSGKDTSCFSTFRGPQQQMAANGGKPVKLFMSEDIHN